MKPIFNHNFYGDIRFIYRLTISVLIVVFVGGGESHTQTPLHTYHNH